MNIIYVSHWRFPSEKTMSPLIMKTCEGFARRGFGVELWVPRRRNPAYGGIDPFEHHGIERNFTIRRLPVLDLVGILPGDLGFIVMVATFQVAAFIYYGLSLPRRQAGFSKAYLYFHDVRDAVLFSSLRRPQFLEIHDFYKSSLDWLNRFVFGRTTGFIVTNRYKMGALKKEFGILEEKMLHQPNAVDIKVFDTAVSKEEARKRLNLPPDKKIILYTGHLFYWKGADVLLEAARNFQSPISNFQNDTLFIFVGGTDGDIQEFKVKSEKLKVKNIVIAGRKPHGEVPLWQKAADVLVLPSSGKYPESREETSPVKLFEYMASGTPIVASDLPSVRNVVDDSMVWFFEADNPRALVKVIKEALNSSRSKRDSNRCQMARKEVEKYTWEKRVENIKEFIERTLV